MPTGTYDRTARRMTAEQRTESARRRLAAHTEVTDSGCWQWTGAVTNGGYGRLQMPDGSGRSTAVVAHRVSYELHVGPIPDGLQIDHLCRNRACVNPEHLEPVTPRTNVWRAPSTQARLNGSKTHCLRGHEFTPENTYRPPMHPEHRACRICRTENMRQIRARRREAA